MYREDLFDRFMSGNSVYFHTADGKEKCGIIQAVEREDGSGYNFNVRVRSVSGVDYTVFVRCTRPN